MTLLYDILDAELSCITKVNDKLDWYDAHLSGIQSKLDLVSAALATLEQSQENIEPSQEEEDENPDNGLLSMMRSLGIDENDPPLDDVDSELDSIMKELGIDEDD